MVEVVIENPKREAECNKCWSIISYRPEDIAKYDVHNWPYFRKEAIDILHTNDLIYKLDKLDSDYIICPVCKSHFRVGKWTGNDNFVRLFNENYVIKASERSKFRDHFDIKNHHILDILYEDLGLADF